eukprot:1825083-Prorocentrum_lima.AAC.1
MGVLPGNGVGHAPPGFRQPRPLNPASGIINNRFDKRGRFTPKEDPNIVFIEGKPYMNKRQHPKRMAHGTTGRRARAHGKEGPGTKTREPWSQGT